MENVTENGDNVTENVTGNVKSVGDNVTEIVNTVGDNVTENVRSSVPSISSVQSETKRSPTDVMLGWGTCGYSCKRCCR